MTLALLLIIVVGTPLSVGPGHASSAKPVVAIVTAIKGTVEVQAAGTTSFTRITSTRQLHDGDVLRLAQRATATLITQLGGARPLIGKARVTISAKAAAIKSSSGIGLRSRLANLMGPSVRSAPMSVRLAGSDGLLIEAPRYSKCLTGRPVFRWQSSGLAREYLLEVKDAGGTVVYQATTCDRTLVLPDDMILTPGRYGVRVATVSPPGSPSEDGAEFSVVTPEEAARISSAVRAAREARWPADAPNLPLIGVLIASGQFDDAISTINEARLAYPEDRALHLLLADAYGMMHRDQDQVRELEAGSPSPQE